MCPPLEDLGGSNEGVDSRWQSLLDSGCRTGQELARAWRKLAAQAYQMSEFVGEEMTGPLTVSVPGAGEGSVLQRRPKEFGELVSLVHGAFGEGSEDVHALISSMAKAQVEKLPLLEGRQKSDWEFGLVTGQLRRFVSTAVV